MKIKSYKKAYNFAVKGSVNNDKKDCMSLKTRRFWLESGALSRILFNILTEKSRYPFRLTKKVTSSSTFLGSDLFFLFYFAPPSHTFVMRFES